MTAADATRLAGEAYRTRLARGEATTPDDKTRLAQKGYRSRLARDAADGQPDTSELYRPGEKIGGRYEVSAIHHGELGVVYGCFDHQTKRPRALKTVRARHARDKQVLSLFESEATVWISLEKHPYIVRAYLVDRFKNLPYVITEYVRGPEGMEGDLRGWLGHPRLTLPVAVGMALQIAQGMQHAVRKVPNLVHRDLKPGNILVNGDAKAMVTDFGLVHEGQSDAGTPAYMSPEQWRAEALDARSDIYSFGCILFEMFTAHRLFPALTEHDWERAHLESPPAALTGIVRELPGEIDQFVRRCLAKDSVARPQSWDEIVAFFADWYHRLTGKAVVLDFSSLALDAGEWIVASYSLRILGRYEEALRACDRALAIDQNYAHAWYCKGIILEDGKRYAEALEAYDRVLVIDQNHAGAWTNKGRTFHSLKRYAEALEAYDRVLVIDQNHAGAWTNKGRTFFSLKRYEEAAGAYDRALTLDPNDSTEREYRRALQLATVVAWSKKGNAMLQLERYEEALQAYDRALAIDQCFVEAWNNKGITLYHLKRYEEAIQAYDRALPIAINQDLIVAWNNKANALCNLKRYEEAIQACDRALAINQNDAAASNTKGIALHNLKRYAEANQADDRALAIDQNSPAAGNNKGRPLHNLKRYEEAIQANDRALAIDATNAVALRGRNSAADALDAARQSTSVNGNINHNDAARCNNKGIALHNLKHYEEAIQAYDRALAFDQNYSGAWCNKGRALYDLKRYEEAIQAYDRELAIDPRNAVALRARNSAVDALKAARRPWFSWTRFFGE